MLRVSIPMGVDQANISKNIYQGVKRMNLNQSCNKSSLKFILWHSSET